MSDMDRLRDEFSDEDLQDDEIPVPLGIELDDDYDDDTPRRTNPSGCFGLTAGERAFLSVMLFLVVVVLGLSMLVFTERIVF